MAGTRNRPGKSARVDPSSGERPRFSFGRGQSGRNAGDLAEVSAVAEVMDWIIRAGDALMVSTTSDGGAIVITVLSGDSREKAYAAGQMELDGVFQALAEHYKPDP